MASASLMSAFVIFFRSLLNSLLTCSRSWLSWQSLRNPRYSFCTLDRWMKNAIECAECASLFFASILNSVLTRWSSDHPLLSQQKYEGSNEVLIPRIPQHFQTFRKLFGSPNWLLTRRPGKTANPNHEYYTYPTLLHPSGVCRSWTIKIEIRLSFCVSTVIYLKERSYTAVIPYVYRSGTMTTSSFLIPVYADVTPTTTSPLTKMTD